MCLLQVQILKTSVADPVLYYPDPDPTFLIFSKQNVYAIFFPVVTLNIEDQFFISKLYFRQYYITRKMDLQGSVCGLRIRIRAIRIDPDPQHCSTLQVLIPSYRNIILYIVLQDYTQQLQYQTPAAVRPVKSSYIGPNK